jgi:K+-sensing histidine kinase KdpD
MLDVLLAHKVAIGRILSVVGATATVVIFEYSFESPWYVAVPAGAVAYVTMPIMWTSLLDSFVAQTRR